MVVNEACDIIRHRCVVMMRVVRRVAMISQVLVALAAKRSTTMIGKDIQRHKRTDEGLLLELFSNLAVSETSNQMRSLANTSIVLFRPEKAMHEDNRRVLRVTGRWFM